MSLQTNTLALIYELQNQKQNALKIYEKILKQDDENVEAKLAIERIKNKKMPTLKDDLKEFLNAFNELETNNQAQNKLQKWLAQWN